MEISGMKSSSTKENGKENYSYSLLDITPEEAETLLRGLQSAEAGKEGYKIAEKLKRVISELQASENTLEINDDDFAELEAEMKKFEAELKKM